MVITISLVVLGVLVVASWFLFRKKSDPAEKASPRISESIDKKAVENFHSHHPIATEAPKKLFSLPAGLRTWISHLKGDSSDRSQWERLLIEADFGPKLTKQILDEVALKDGSQAELLKMSLCRLLDGSDSYVEKWSAHKPWVLFVIGVNGVGKTTSVSKLAYFFKELGLKVGVVGADTFRKAAQEQLERGLEKVGVDFFTILGSESSEGADPSAVVFDGLRKFSEKDIIIVDTSGRLHTKTPLMDELKKMKRVADKSLPGSPHDTWMIIDSTLGQNSVVQTKSFHEALGLTGIVLTKLDGLSRGGTIFQLYHELKIPICFLGLGESVKDLIRFNTKNFIQDLFDQEGSSS